MCAVARFCLLAFVLFLSIAFAHAAERKVALVIGNSKYVNAPELANPANDAADIAAKLKTFGFDVTTGSNLTKVQMEQSIRDFAEKLANADSGLLFYAGHGFQVGGENYLVPVDAKLATVASLDFEIVSLNLIQRAMERAAQTNVIILDACRNNPFARNLSLSFGSRAISVKAGLARMEAGRGTLVSFSTQPGGVASDGEGRNSPFTDALLKHIGSKGDDISSMLIDVRRDVIEATNHNQVPWENSALIEKFYFAPPPPPGPTPEQQMEMQFWDTVKNSKSQDVLRSYLIKFPAGTFVPLASALIEQIEQQQRLEQAAQEEKKRREEADSKAADVQRIEAELSKRQAAFEEEKRRFEALQKEAAEKAALAAKVEQQRQKDEAKLAGKNNPGENARKQAEIAAASAAKAEEERKLEAAKLDAEKKVAEELQRLAELKHGDELRQAREEARLAHEAADAAEQRRLAAEQAAANASKKTAEVAKAVERNHNQQIAARMPELPEHLRKCAATSCSAARSGCYKKCEATGHARCLGCEDKYQHCMQTGTFEGKYCHDTGLARR